MNPRNVSMLVLLVFIMLACAANAIGPKTESLFENNDLGYTWPQIDSTTTHPDHGNYEQVLPRVDKTTGCYDGQCDSDNSWHNENYIPCPSHKFEFDWTKICNGKECIDTVPPGDQNPPEEIDNGQKNTSSETVVSYISYIMYGADPENEEYKQPLLPAFPTIIGNDIITMRVVVNRNDTVNVSLLNRGEKISIAGWQFHSLVDGSNIAIFGNQSEMNPGITSYLFKTPAPTSTGYVFIGLVDTNKDVVASAYAKCPETIATAVT